MSTSICSVKTYQNIYSGLRKFHTIRYATTLSAIDRLYECVYDNSFSPSIYLCALSQLYALNIMAFNFLYNETYSENIAPEQLKEMCEYLPDISFFQFLKSLECLVYQMSEGEIPSHSVTYQRLSDLIVAICKDVAHEAPLYNTTEWD